MNLKNSYLKFSKPYLTRNILVLWNLYYFNTHIMLLSKLDSKDIVTIVIIFLPCNQRYENG